MIFSSRSYAIGMAHFQIAGGWKSLIGLGAAYVAGAVSIIGIVLYNTNSFQVPRALVSLFTMFFVIEAFMVVLLGGFRVAGCIRTDLVTNMIESHRQMPIAAWRAMMGYLMGTTAHVTVLTALNVIVLAILAGAAHQSFDNFVVSQIVLVVFAFFVWSFAAMNTFMFKQVAPLMVLGVMFGSISGMFLGNFGILPGVSLLIAPFLGESIFNLSGGIFSIRAVYPIALTAQAAFAALFFVGACRRYRGTFLTTFNVPLGLGLVLVWSMLSVASIYIWPDVTGALIRNFGQPESRMQIVSSLFVAAMMMIVPIHALTAWEARHPVKPHLRVMALATAAAAGLLILLAGPVEPYRWLISLLVIGVHVATVYLALRAFRIFTPMTTLVLMAAVMLAVWLMPLLAEGVLTSFFSGENEVPRDFKLVGTLSPLGLLIKVWTESPAWQGPLNPIPGLFCQTLVPLAFWRFGKFLVRRNPQPAV